MKKHYPLVLFLMITVNFFLPRLMPGDPFLYLSRDNQDVSIGFSEEQIAQYKAYYGLDKLLGRQYLHYLTDLLQGNLGYSIYYNTPVLKMILTRLPWTMFIVLTALALSAFIGILLGSLSAWLSQRAADGALYFLMVFLSEIPAFLLGVVLLFIFAAKLQWFPLSGGITPFRDFYSMREFFLDLFHHGALPITTLALSRIGEFYLLSRSSMLTILSQHYMTTARAKGLSRCRILFRHALRNAAPPVIAKIFMSIGMLFGGAVLIENVFNYPGIGRLMREAVLLRDYVLIQGIFFFVTLMVLLMNWLADLVYKTLDPRIHYA